MDVGTLEQWLWDAACEIRGPFDAPKFKDYLLPLPLLKRLPNAFQDDTQRPWLASSNAGTPLPKSSTVNPDVVWFHILEFPRCRPYRPETIRQALDVDAKLEYGLNALESTSQCNCVPRPRR